MNGAERDSTEYRAWSKHGRRRHTLAVVLEVAGGLFAVVAATLPWVTTYGDHTFTGWEMFRRFGVSFPVDEFVDNTGVGATGIVPIVAGAMLLGTALAMVVTFDPHGQPETDPPYPWQLVLAGWVVQIAAAVMLAVTVLGLVLVGDGAHGGALASLVAAVALDLTAASIAFAIPLRLDD